jgi:hypothetical protein
MFLTHPKKNPLKEFMQIKHLSHLHAIGYTVPTVKEGRVNSCILHG